MTNNRTHLNETKPIRNFLNKNKQILREKSGFLRDLYHFVSYLIRPSGLYENIISPNLAFYLSWFLWPFYFLAKKAKLSFLINNMTFSPGQVVLELDYFFRRLYTGDIPSDHRYIVIWPSYWLTSDVAYDTRKIYHTKFFIFVVNDLIYYLLLPFFSRFPDITCDCGVGLQNCLIVDNNNQIRSNTFPVLQNKGRSLLELLEIEKHYSSLRMRTPGFCPMKPSYPMTSELLDFLSEAMPKYALIQIRTSRVNGTLKPTDPSTYLEAIDFLKKSGFGIVFAGREAMPEVFHDLGILNYASWKGASFFHDLQLIAGSKFVLSSASGFSVLSDVMEIPLVYSNNWIPYASPPGRFTVCTPTLLHDSDGRLMRFADQMAYSLKTTGKNNYYDLNKVNLLPRVATSRELLEATKESLLLESSFQTQSDLQNQFKSLTFNTPFHISSARISQYFIESHQNLL
jgi:putative glycosyltransferase (TIGR04372 family)